MYKADIMPIIIFSTNVRSVMMFSNRYNYMSPLCKASDTAWVSHNHGGMDNHISAWATPTLGNSEEAAASSASYATALC